MKRIDIKLTPKDKKKLQSLCKKGSLKARYIERAHILLLADENMRRMDIASILKVSRTKIFQTITKYNSEGLDGAIYDKNRVGRPIVFGDDIKSEIIALSCTTPPNGYAKWSCPLLQEEMKKRGCNISDERIRLILKENKLKPWKKKCGALGS